MMPGTAKPMYAPELYRAGRIETPLESVDQIDEAQIARFDERGFIAVRNFFSPEQVQQARDAMRNIMLTPRETLDETGMQVSFEAAVLDHIESMSDQERIAAVRKLFRFRKDPTLGALMHCEMITDLLSRMMGKAPKLLQEMALCKPAKVGREKPWHQDQAYFQVPVATKVIGIWIALDDATVENGCMHLIEGAHHDGALPHFSRRDWQICDTDILGRPITACPLPAGGALLFSGLLPHGTPHNFTDKHRWSLQFHYAPHDTPTTSREERMAVFGNEGRDVSC